MPGAINPGLRRKALRSFKQRGFAVHVKALETVLDTFQNSDQSDDLPGFLEKIFEHLSRPGVTEDGILTLKVAEEISERVTKSTARQEGNSDAAFEVINVFSAPAWQPSVGSGSSMKTGGMQIISSASIAGRADAKAQLFRSRFELMRSKTLRNPRFTPPASRMLSRTKESPYLQLTGIESLAGTNDEKLVLGMLTQLEEGSWYLEDLHGNIKVDLSDARVTAGLHTECSFVIAQGQLVEAESGEMSFKISAMGTPPLEDRETSLSALGKDCNLFGGHFDPSQVPTLVKMEQEDESAAILMLSDVALDNPRVMFGLRHIFKGYLEDEAVPRVIVLMGSFLSHPFGQYSDDLSLLTSKLTELGRLLASEFPQIAHESAFVFVPSLQDPGPGNVLPRPPLPRIVTAGFEEAIKSGERLHLGTNPCRIRYMSQEIVLFREDLMQKMVRHCCIKPDMDETNIMSKHLIKSIVDQAHLSPLPLLTRPTIWNFDHALRLFPTPHVVVIADKVDCYVCNYGGALALNPGSFASDFSFSVYLPGKRHAEPCSIDNTNTPGEEPSSSEDRRTDTGSDDDSDSGHSFHSMLRAGKDSDDGSESGGDLDLDDLPQPPPVEAQRPRKPPQNDTGPIIGETQSDLGDTQTAADSVDQVDAVMSPKNDTVPEMDSARSDPGDTQPGDDTLEQEDTVMAPKP